MTNEGETAKTEQPRGQAHTASRVLKMLLNKQTKNLQALCVTALTAKCYDLSLGPKTHILEGQKWFQHIVFIFIWMHSPNTHTTKRCFSRKASWTSMHQVNNCQQGLQWRSWRHSSARLKTRGCKGHAASLRMAHFSKSATANSWFLTIPINYIYSLSFRSQPTIMP